MAVEVQPTGEAGRRTAYRICPLCEATCGLELTIADERVVRVVGDKDHVFSHGFICPKGAVFGQVVEDPDRLRRPLVRRGDTHVEVSWDEAFAVIEERLGRVVRDHGSEAVALYLGNPNVHQISGGLYLKPFIKSLGTHNVYSASTVDQMPKHVSSGNLFGSALASPVPDLDRTDYLLMLGANPYESNGSLCTAPDFPGRLKAIQARGGRFVVVDPRRTRTADEADEHIFIRPGGDVFLLFGIAHTLFDEGLVDLGDVAPHVNGVDELAALAKEFTPERVAPACAVGADVIRRLARELSAAPTAAVYGRIGTCTVEFGTLCSWLVDVVNVLTGNLDRPGGAMFPLPAHTMRRPPGQGRGFRTGRWASRVSRHPEVVGEFPVAALAEEIETAGPGQVRALFTVAGNPVLSTPNSERLDAAIGSLELVVSVDPYLNETTRHADVVLPPTDATRAGHYDFAFLNYAVRNTVTYSPPVNPPDEGGMDECDILARLMLIGTGQGAATDVAVAHEFLLVRLLQQAVSDPDSPVHGRDPAELRPQVGGSTPAERLLDVLVRIGAYGDGFGADPAGLTVERLKDAPHGVDLGPLQPRVPEVLRTASGRIELCPPPLTADVARLSAAIDDRAEGMVLVGRRHLRSNNSWMHNVPALVKGRDRCTLQVHPEDAVRLGVGDGGSARVTSRVGSVVAPVEVTDSVMRGVVSLPHGWGHDRPGTRQSVANAHAGVNSNVLTDESVIDPLSGNAVLNGIPVTVEPVHAG